MKFLVNERVDYLISSYVSGLSKLIGSLEPIVVLYGSAVNGVSTSDLDICTVLYHYGEEEKRLLKEYTINFHKTNNLLLDDEVPFEQKCVYSFANLDEVINHPPFHYSNGRFIIKPIQKTKEYLASDEVRNRLLFNILTTNSMVIYGNSQVFEGYKEKAWKSLIRVVFSNLDNKPMTIDEFIDNICKNPRGEEFGEMYLGYSRENEKLNKYLIERCTKEFSLLIAEGKLIYHTDGKVLHAS